LDRPVLMAVVITCTVGVLSAVAFIGLGGYWENWPGLDRISGAWRFRQFVMDPVPRSVVDLRGGYSGFPSGYVRTAFSYSGETLPFLDGWTRVSTPDVERKVAGAHFVYTTAYRKNGGAFLLLNEQTKQGCLYVPGH